MTVNEEFPPLIPITIGTDALLVFASTLFGYSYDEHLKGKMHEVPFAPGSWSA